MKRKMKSVLSLAMFFLLTLAVNAQINLEGSDEYGRLYDISYDLNTENKLYALTFGNHIVMSEDNGQNWEVIYSYPANGPSLNGLRTFGNDSLSFYIKNSVIASDNTIYIFDINTEEIVKQYTPPVSAGADKSWVSSYSMYENDTDVVLFEQSYKIGNASYSKVYYTSNGGDTWNEVYYNVDFDSVFPNNVAISPNDPEKLFILRGNGPTSVDGGLLISEDAGATWIEKISGQLLKAIAFNPSDPDTILIGTNSGSSTVQNIHQSVDGGATWNALPIPWDSYSIKYINYIGYDPNNLDNILVLESNEIATSSDGGLSWTNYIYADQPGSYFFGLDASFNPFQPDEIMITTDYYPVVTTDGGATVSQLKIPLFFATEMGVSSEGDQHLYYSVQRGIVHKNLTTLEETPHYVQPVNLFFSGNAPKYIIEPTIEGRVYMFVDGFNGQSLSYSDDHGATMNFLKTSWFDQFLHIETDPNNSNIIWASYQNEGTFMIDFTNSPIITPISKPTYNPHLSTLIDLTDSNNVLIGLGGELYQTLDSGTTWANVSTGLTLDPQLDGIYSINQNPYNSNEYMLATNQGVFKSVDGAQNWSQVYTGNNVRKLEYSTINEGHLVASITSSLLTQAQVIYSLDNGEDWLEVTPSAIENSSSYSMDFMFHQDSITVYLATIDLGVISYEIDTTIFNAPPNDLCEGAIAITCGEIKIGQTNFATNTGNPGTCDTDLSEGPGVWYTLTIPNDGDYEVTVNTIGSSFDTKLGIFSGACGATVCVAGNDDIGGGVLQSEVVFEGASGETYSIYVTGSSDNVGLYKLKVTCDTLLGTSNNEIKGLSYYPNPTSDVINLNAQDNIEMVTIYNILGQKVIEQNINAMSTKLDVANLTTGTYIMIVTVEGITGSYKILKE